MKVAGTTAMDGDKAIGIANAYEQTYFILSKIQKCLEHFGAGMKMW